MEIGFYVRSCRNDAEYVETNTVLILPRISKPRGSLIWPTTAVRVNVTSARHSHTLHGEGVLVSYRLIALNPANPDIGKNNIYS